MLRRAVVVGLVALAALFLSSVAAAGSYLDRSTLLLDANRRDAVILRQKMTDKELARVVQTVADARQEAASKMDVPASVAKAHPHLLLSLAKVERAAKAALDGNYSSVIELLDASAREEGLFRASLDELGFPLPKPKAAHRTHAQSEPSIHHLPRARARARARSLELSSEV